MVVFTFGRATPVWGLRDSFEMGAKDRITQLKTTDANRTGRNDTSP